jgi:broad specificity phosphatase PhoE
MLLYLARHAQTASSAVDSLNGQRELPLTAHGLEQARALGARLAGVRFAGVYRSPLGRTAQTAELIAPGLQAQVLPGLTEIDYGEWEGLSHEQARARDPERYAAWVADPVRVSPPGGETIAQLAGRAMEAVRLIEAQHGASGLPALAVSHKATLRALGAALTGAPLESYRTRWAQDECALDLVELRPGKPPFLRLWNDTAHLGTDPGATTRSGH